MVQRCVIVQKDEKGYGLTVSGDNPVFVQSVKDSKDRIPLNMTSGAKTNY